MGIFADDNRMSRMESALIKHMEKEERSFTKLIETLDSIKDEINETNRQMREYHNDTEIRLLKLHDSMITEVHDKYVTKEAFSSHKDKLYTSVRELSKNKIDKSNFKIIISTITAIALIFSWILNTYSKLPG